MRVTVGPWFALWSGGRLADIYHLEAPDAIECLQVVDYDWAKGEVIMPEGDVKAHIKARVAEWAREYGPTYIREVVRYQR